MSVLATKSYKNHKLVNLYPQIQKIYLIYILIAILFFACMKVDMAVIFFYLNLIVSNVYIWSTKLLHLYHIIVKMFSGRPKINPWRMVF